MSRFITKREAEYVKYHTCPICGYKKYYYRITKSNYRCLNCKAIFRYVKERGEFIFIKYD